VVWAELTAANPDGCPPADLPRPTQLS